MSQMMSRRVIKYWLLVASGLREPARSNTEFARGSPSLEG